MSDSAYPTFRKINYTPLRDLVRLRVSGRLDWRSCLAAANLPKPAADLICRVVKRTRLWPLERGAVADELIAHFADGLAAGHNAGQLMERFGDERVAAKLIRRAKRRGRPWPWHVWSVSFRVTVRVIAAALAIYAILLIRFCVGRPTPSVDYLAKLNAPIIAVPQSDRAWPVWRQAILAISNGVKDDQLSFPAEIYEVGSPKPLSLEMVKWLDQHAGAIDLARQAARKPVMGFVLGPGGSAEDPELRFAAVWGKGHALVEVLSPYYRYTGTMTCLLSLDAKRAVAKGDKSIVEADIISMLGLARQSSELDGNVFMQGSWIGVNTLAMLRVRSVLLNDPGLLDDDQWSRVAHELSRPRVAADFISLKAERYLFADLVQRVYTDDGHGDGRMTLSGVRALPILWANSSKNAIAAAFHGIADQPPDWRKYAAAATLPRMTASRAELMALYDHLMDQNEANLRKPMRQIDFAGIESQVAEFENSRLKRIRYAVLIDPTPSISQLQWYCERYLGERDGVVVGIALELYRRHHGHYPATLDELTPELLPEVPADRITGDPVKYRLIDGKPVVYSVGADRIDDGGRPPSVVDPRLQNWVESSRLRARTGMEWGIDPKDAARGDWLLFAPDSTDPEGN